MISDRKLMRLVLGIIDDVSDLGVFYTDTIAEDHRQDLVDDLEEIKAILDKRKL